MNQNSIPQSESQAQLADLTETLERDKVELTPEVEKYIDENVRKVKANLQNGVPIYPKDLAFIQSVVAWIDLPDRFKEKWPSIKKMENQANYSQKEKEADERGLESDQWRDLVELGKAKGWSIKKIDRDFKYVDGRIQCSHLNLKNINISRLPRNLDVHSYIIITKCNNLTTLPQGLELSMLQIYNCKNFTQLPPDLKSELIDISACPGIESVPSTIQVNTLAIHMCKRFKKLPAIPGLNKIKLTFCPKIQKLPNGLNALANLNILKCKKIKALPDDLNCRYLLLSSVNKGKPIHTQALELKDKGQISEIYLN